MCIRDRPPHRPPRRRTPPRHARRRVPAGGRDDRHRHAADAVSEACCACHATDLARSSQRGRDRRGREDAVFCRKKVSLVPRCCEATRRGRAPRFARRDVTGDPGKRAALKCAAVRFPGSPVTSGWRPQAAARDRGCAEPTVAGRSALRPPHLSELRARSWRDCRVRPSQPPRRGLLSRRSRARGGGRSGPGRGRGGRRARRCCRAACG